MDTYETFFPSIVIEYNKLDNNIWNLEWDCAFKKEIHTFIACLLCGIQLLTRLWVGQVICMNTNLDAIFKTP